ncbi:MAG: ABC transporter ATP-binding protein [Phycisphaerales bacterium]|nr:MAG: ABC transporter ATP-binding protein [Phycisphaerales bacterium]
MTTRIEIADLSKHFGSGAGAARAVDGITCDIEPGELFFLLGPSGCGKTTLLRMIAGFIDPTGGHIRFNGRDVTHLPPNKRNTGMVFQSYALWPHMTVEANVAFGLGVRKVPKSEQKSRALEALAAVRMEPYAARKPNQLSGGQQQRVALARALVIRPDVLLLDEPLSNLDAKLRIDLRSEIRRVCKQAGITTVYVTHDQKEALSMADRVAILDAGKVVQVGTPRACYRRPVNRFVAEFLGETNFVPGKVLTEPDSRGLVELETPAGPLRAAAPEGVRLRTGSAVTCSVRPEAFRLSDADDADTNALPAVHRETTYLGEIAQHLVELKPRPGQPAQHELIKLAELNPSGANVGHGQLRPGAEVRISADPGDVVILPPEDGPAPTRRGSTTAAEEPPVGVGAEESRPVVRTASSVEEAIRGSHPPSAS